MFTRLAICVFAVSASSLALASVWSLPVYKCHFSDPAATDRFEQVSGARINYILVTPSSALREAFVQIDRTGDNKILGESCFVTSLELWNGLHMKSKVSYPCGHTELAEPLHTMSLAMFEADSLTGARPSTLTLGGSLSTSELVCRPQ